MEGRQAKREQNMHGEFLDPKKGKEITAGRQ
jgi:hypothetical protein